MSTSILIAKLLGLMYVFVGLGMLLSGKYYKKMFDSFIKELGAVYIGGLMALVVGFLIVTYHNVWQGWPILVSLIGWLALIKGFMLLVLPEVFMDKFKSMFKTAKCVNWVGVFALLLGAVFCYFGFFS